VAIDGDEVTYESLCGECYLDESGGRLASGHPPVDGSTEIPGPDSDFS